MGILIMPGWMCCDAWQHWIEWGEEQHMVANESLRSLAQRLAPHPSILAFMYGSDALAPLSGASTLFVVDDSLCLACV